MPARVSRSKEGGKLTRVRSPATVNRDMVPFRAALNMALERGEVSTALAWREALQPAEAKGRRNLYLDNDQRRALLAELPEDMAAFAAGCACCRCVRAHWRRCVLATLTRAGTSWR